LGVGLGAMASLLLLTGFLAGTVGAIGVIFVLGDTVPIHSELVKPDLNCYVTSWGNVTTPHSGYYVVFKRQVPIISVLEYVVGQEAFEDPNFEPIEACSRARNALAGQPSHGDPRIQEPHT